MEQEIATQVVGLGGNSDFTLWSLFLRAGFCSKICNNNSFSELSLFLGTYF